jgi:hypothetical protein
MPAVGAGRYVSSGNHSLDIRLFPAAEEFFAGLSRRRQADFEACLDHFYINATPDGERVIDVGFGRVVLLCWESELTFICERLGSELLVYEAGESIPT